MLCVAHVVAGLDPAYGGPSYTVPRLCAALAAAGIEPIVLSVAAAASDSVRQGYRDRRFRQAQANLPALRTLRRSPALLRGLRDLAPGCGLVHGHGLWLWPNLATARAAAAAGKPLVLSPRGMLSPTALAFSPTKKRAVWRLWQEAALRRAACLHATSLQEYVEIRALGLGNPVVVIANGIDLPAAAAPAPAARRVVLSLGRIHPKKGLDRLLRAWALVEARHPRWQLRIVGPAEAGHDEELRALAQGLGLARAAIEGAVYGEAKSDAYRAASLFVLPSLNENFGVTVAEALAAAVPAIATQGAPWSGLAGEGCGWWIEHGVEPLADALDRALAMPCEALRTMGVRGRAWMARDFSWDRVARDMLEVYLWLAKRANPPAMVRFD